MGLETPESKWLMEIHTDDGKGLIFNQSYLSQSTLGKAMKKPAIFVSIVLLLLSQQAFDVHGGSFFSGDTSLPEKEELLLFFEEEELFVEAASRVREPISEAPAVVNIITEEEIRDMGARNLLDVLYTIPGFTDIQDTNEHVVAPRGVFASSTHKILLLRDGHRLNDPLFEEIMPANAISLESIKRIEVMRGSGASLYGNASLLAVINIVTLDRDAPSKVSIGIGNLGQKTFDLVYNKPLSGQGQFLFFSSFYDADGETIRLTPGQDTSNNPISGEHLIDGRPLNYDIGFKYKRGKSIFSFSKRRASYSAPRSNGGQLLTASDSLVEPQQDIDFIHLGFQYLPEWKHVRFNLRHYVDYSKFDTPQFITPSREKVDVTNQIKPNQAFELMLATVRGGMEYSGAFDHAGGTVIMGLQLEAFRLVDSNIETSFDDNSTLVRQPKLLEKTELNTALYVREKLNLRPDLILNAGLRWDYYESGGNSLNPRLAIIYNPFGRFYAKAIYGRAFQVPAYFYRQDNGGLGYGATDALNPETMDTYQLSFQNWFKKNRWLRATFFYNALEGLISLDRDPNPNQYRNFENITTVGAETEASITLGSALTLFGSHAYVRPVGSKTDPSLLAGRKLKNIPPHSAQLGLRFRHKPNLSGSLYGSWHDRVMSPTKVSADNEIPSATILNLAVNLSGFYEHFEASLKIHNLLGKRDFRGGPVSIPYPQEGTNIIFTLGNRF